MTTPTTLAVAGAAGSSGKSTTVAALAALLGEDGKKVIVVDADAQGTATQWLGLQPDEAEFTLADVLLRKEPIARAIVQTDVPGVSIIPGNDTLHAVGLQLPAMHGGELRLRKALKGLPADVDVVLIDCPGSLQLVSISAMVAADHVLTVAFPTMKEIQGIPALIDALDEVRELLNDQVTLSGIIPCMVPPATQGKVYTEALAVLTRHYGSLVTPAVRRSSQVAVSHAAGVPLPVHAPRERVTKDYRDVFAWLREREVL
ncbi:ParA family protein [Propioniciclava soli]|uniref:ParA family protein n=1 Tax=Propioniciclava soli TaxID=2775081 RepID=UPI001E5031E4|nr:ParA family protein [Propioniciclava soli]